MKALNNREAGNKRTSDSLGANESTTEFLAPYYAAQALANCNLPQPSLTHKRNPNIHQSDFLNESYQQNSTQTDLVIKECLTQPKKPKQSSLVHENQFIKQNNLQDGQLSPISLQHSDSGRPPSSGLSSHFSGYTEPYYAAQALANGNLPQPSLTHKRNPNIHQSDFLNESYQQNSTQTDLVIKECLTQPKKPKQSSLVHENQFIKQNNLQDGQLSPISLQHSDSGRPPSSGLSSHFSGYTEPYYAAQALANCNLPQPSLTHKRNPNIHQSDFLNESYQQNSTQTDLVIKECLTQPKKPKQSSLVHENQFIKQNNLQDGQLSPISLQHSDSGRPPSSDLSSHFSGYTEPYYAAQALANCNLPQPSLTHKRNPNIHQSDFLNESYQQNSTQTDLVIKECLTQPKKPKQSSLVHENQFIKQNNLQDGQLSPISLQHSDSGRPSSSGLSSHFSGYTEPYYAAQALANCNLPQPSLTHKRNPNIHQSDFLNESYQQNSTQTDLVIKECLTQPKKPKQSSLVHENQFIKQNNLQDGQLSPISLQHSDSGRPPSSGLSSHFSGYTEPYYAAQALANGNLPQPSLTHKRNPNIHQSDFLNESYQQNSTQTDLVIKECLTQRYQPKQSSLVYPNQFIQRQNIQAGQLSSISLQKPSGKLLFSSQPSPSSGQLPPYQPGAYQPHYGPYFGGPPGAYHYSTQVQVPSAAGNEPPIKKYDFRGASRDLIRQLTISEVRKHVLDNKRGTTFGSVMHILESSKQIDMTVHGHFYVDLIIEMLNSDEFSHIHNWIQVINQEERFMREKERRKRKQEEINCEK